MGFKIIAKTRAKMKKRIVKKWLNRYSKLRRAWKISWENEGSKTKYNKHRQFYTWLNEKGFKIVFE
jgi:hypothetical protein